MKKIFSSLALAVCAAMLAGCDDYQDRYTPEYASVARLEIYGEQDMTAWTINDTEVFDVKVLRSGHDISIPVVITARVMTDAEWNNYAATYGLNRFYKIPDDCFTFVGSTAKTSADIAFEPDQFVGETSVELFCGKLNTFSQTLPPPEEEGDEFANIICLPMIIEADQGSVMASQNTLLLKIISKDATLSLSKSGFEAVSCLATSNSIVRNYTISLSCDNPWGFTAHVANSQTALDAYNAEHGTHYTLVQPGTLEVLDGETWKDWADFDIEFPAGRNSADLSVRINPDKAGMMDALALTVGNPSLNLKVDPAELTNIVAVQVKPSNTRLKVGTGDITASVEDSAHPAKNLYDGKRTTYFSSGEFEHDGDPVYGSYVDMKLPQQVRYFAFDFMSRYDYFGTGEGIPNEVHIYTSTDGKTWEKSGEITNMRRDFNGKSQTVTYGNFDAGKNVTYVRWAVVRGGAVGDLDLREAATTAHWDATALYIFGK